MCGIAGLMRRAGSEVDIDRVAPAMMAALTHRGPDGNGVRLLDGIALIHTRLAIVDPAGGRQPLISGDGVALVANAEIYNDPELRRALATDFETGSDCESALHLYRRDGVEFARGLRGMFALALHDPARRRLVLARDPFGIKPLYYAEIAAGFVFASEPQAIVASGLVRAELNTAARDEVLALQFSSDRETVFADILRVLPGETLVVEDGRIVARHHVPAITATPSVQRNDDDACAAFDAAWRDSVRAHQRADVPYGLFLSGGIDSAAVLAMMARLNTQPVLAFTAAFPGTRAHDERAAAKAVAAAAGAIHVEIEMGSADFWASLPAIAAALDDPVADYAVVPTYLLAKQAVRDVKVILTGEGGDEMFAGYGRYRAAVRPILPKRPWRRSILAGFDGLRAPLGRWRRAVDAAEHAVEGAGFRGIGAAQALDCATWLPGDLLTKLDRCLMAHGVEGRVPFLDPAVANLAFALPDRLRVRGQGKWLVRRWLARNFPAARAAMPKRGFTVPVAEWIAAEGKRLGPLVAREPGIAALCRPGTVEALFADLGVSGKGHMAWTLLFYALWHRRHMLGLAPVGDVFTTLARC